MSDEKTWQIWRNLVNKQLQNCRSAQEKKDHVFHQILFAVFRTVDTRALLYTLKYTLRKKKAIPYNTAPLHMYILDTSRTQGVGDLREYKLSGLFLPTMYKPKEIRPECSNHGFSIPMLCPNPIHPQRPSFLEICYSKSMQSCYTKCVFPDEFQSRFLQLRIEKFIVQYDHSLDNMEVSVTGIHNQENISLPVYVNKSIKQRFDKFIVAASAMSAVNSIRMMFTSKPKQS